MIVLCDSNLLIHLSNPASKFYDLSQNAVRKLLASGEDLVYTTQNVAEFGCVCTRPTPSGLGLSTEEALVRTEQIEKNFRLLVDIEDIHSVFKRLLVQHRVRGVQVHDARLAAAMVVHNVTHILTFDRDDFRRYSFLSILHPSDL